MDIEEYRKRGKEMVDYIANYLETIRDRNVYPSVEPGYMRHLVPESAPIDGECWENIIEDVDNVIMPGITHWQSPYMHAYFPCLTSFPSMLGDMLADGINCLGFTWASSPAATELETITTDWLGKMLGLPEAFLHTESNGKGGGVIQTTSSEATLIAMLAGRTEALERLTTNDPEIEESFISSKLVAYCSDQAHSSVQKAGIICLMKMRYIESDDDLSMRGNKLMEAIEKDRREGLIPFFVCATLGTTGACSFDNLSEIGPICEKENIWLHVDAAYAGTAFICPEFRIWLKGIEFANSFAFNPSKWMMVNFDCTTMWVKDNKALHRTFCVNPLYLKHEKTGSAIDYMHWQIPLSKKFRSLKLWFVIRNYGVTGLQEHIREGVKLAQLFENFVNTDERFEIPAKRKLGLIVFRLKGENELTERLLKRIISRGKIHCVPADLKGKYVIRFTVTSTRTTSDDILRDWMEIKNTATELLEEEFRRNKTNKVSLAEIKERNETFGCSLLLANSPMCPKIVNGSYVAVFNKNLPQDIFKGWTLVQNLYKDSPVRRRRLLHAKNQLSLDSRLDMMQYCISSKIIENLPSCVESQLLFEVNDQFSEDENSDTTMLNVSMSDLNLKQQRSQSVSVSQNIASEIIFDEQAVFDSHSTFNDIKVCLKCGHVIENKNPIKKFIF